MSYKTIKLTAPKGYRFDKTVGGDGVKFWYLAKKDGKTLGQSSLVIGPDIKVKGVKK